MSEPTQPDAGAPAPEPIAPVPEPSTPPPSPPPSDAPITAREAADLISGKTDKPSAPDGADAAPERPSGETDGSDDPSQKPIDAPRSWTKADKEAFASLPRDTQERILALDRTRELELRRGQNEAAEQRKAAEALAQQAEQAQAQARWQYEQSLPQQALLLDAEYRKEFGTPSWDDLQDWQRNDPLRYQAWDLAYKRLTHASAELQAQQAQQAQQQQLQHQQFMQNAEAWRAEEAQKFADKAPEWKDPKAYPGLVAGMMDYLGEVGFEQDFLQRAATEFLPIQIHDHRFQMLAWDGYQYRQALKATKSPSRAPVPPVQRPGSAPAKGEAQEARFKDLNRQLDRTGSLKDAARLIAAMNGSRSP
jgi:hypothetical protein